MAILLAALAFALPSPTHAGPVVDRIRNEGVIRCGGVPRPGLLGQSPGGREAAGLALDLCRAIGAALIGPEGRLAFHLYDSDGASNRVREGRDDLAFLDGSEILDQRLAGKTIMGPAVAFVSTGVRVPVDSPVRTPADLAGRSVCFEQGSGAHRALEAFMAARKLDFARMPFTETGEMDDAFGARRCDAEAGETGDLAVAGLSAQSRKSRILTEPLAIHPVFAVTPASDPQWAAIVASATFALQRADLPAGPWTASADASRPKGADLGLPDDWAKRVLAAAGTYAEMYDRNLGARSRLQLPRGPNAPAEAGGLFVTPFRE